MDNDITVTFGDGSTRVFTQDEIVRPPFSCCMTAADYVSKILEVGVTIEEIQGADVLTTKFNPECMCSVEFVRSCS